MIEGSLSLYVSIQLVDPVNCDSVIRPGSQQFLASLICIDNEHESADWYSQRGVGRDVYALYQPAPTVQILKDRWGRSM